MRLQLPTGAGGVALKIFPSGIVIFSGRKQPSSIGEYGATKDLNATRAAATAPDSPGIDRARHLITDFREVDGHIAAGDFDSDFELHRPVEMDAIAVEQRFGFVSTGLDARDLLPCQGFRLPPNRFHRAKEGFDSVAIDQSSEPSVPDPAGRNLCAQIAEARFGETDVVLDDLKNILIGLIAAIELQRAKLQPFLVDFARAAESKANPCAADIDPVRPHGEKSHDLAAVKKRRIDHHVVQMLAAHVRMVHDQHVARTKSVLAVHAHAVDDGRAEIGEKDRQGAEVLR